MVWEEQSYRFSGVRVGDAAFLYSLHLHSGKLQGRPTLRFLGSYTTLRWMLLT